MGNANCIPPLPQLVHFQTVTCYSCGIHFALEEGHYRRRLDDHKSFWCPNGHSQHFIGQTEADKLKKELERERKLREMAQRTANMEESRARNAEIQVTRAKNRLKRERDRVANGVCPCCNRTFSNLQRHMEAKHPERVKKARPNKATSGSK